MKFSPSAKYLMYARGAAKTLAWHVYVKKTTSLSDALSAGTWVEVTYQLDENSIDSFRAAIEWEVGQFTADSHEFTGLGIAWWKANIFNAAANEYLELKVMMTLGLGTDLASDTVYVFSGFIDKNGVNYNELTDRLTMSCLTAQDIGERISAEVLTTQYVETDIDGSGTDGLVLFNIPRIFVKDANLSGFALKVGSHKISYEYNGGSPRARLDSGRWITLANGNNDLPDAEISAFDSQKVRVYTPDITLFYSTIDSGEDEIVVTVEGDTLPRQWYRYMAFRALSTQMLGTIGITTLSYDADGLEIATETGSRVSFLDAPPGIGNSNMIRYAMTSDGTDLWIGVDNKLYLRTTSDGTYTLKATLTAGRVITKLLYSSNGHIWVYAQSSNGTGAGFVLRHTISGATNSSQIALTGGSSRYAVEVYDAGGWYGVIYTDMTNHAIRGVLSSSMTDSQLASNTGLGLGYTGTQGPDGNLSFMRSSYYVFQSSNTSNSFMDRIIYTGATWDAERMLTLTRAYQVGAFHTSEDRIYFYDSTNALVRSHTWASATETTVTSIPNTGSEIRSMMYLNSKIYYTTQQDGILYSIVSNAATKLHDALLYQDGTKNVAVRTQYYNFAYISPRLYGIETGGGRLYQYHTNVAFYIPLSKFEGDTVTGAWNRLLKAFMFVGPISAAKSALVYKRATYNGSPNQTGQTLVLTYQDAGDVDEIINFASGVNLVEVTNGQRACTYNGSVYNTRMLTEAKVLQFSSELIPDELIRPIAKWAYTFFSVKYNLYRFTLKNEPLFHFEPIDKIDVTLTTTKIQQTASGPIYATVVYKDGSMEVEALL